MAHRSRSLWGARVLNHRIASIVARADRSSSATMTRRDCFDAANGAPFSIVNRRLLVRVTPAALTRAGSPANPATRSISLGCWLIFDLGPYSLQ